MLTLPTIAQIVAILIIAGWLAFKELKDIRLRKTYDLDDNPTRCMIHKKAIERLQADVAAIREHLGIQGGE